VSGELENFIVQLRTAGIPYARPVHAFRKALSRFPAGFPGDSARL
jgi:hypothetical protein